MTEEPVEKSVDDAGKKASAKKQFRRTMLSTGFSDVPGRMCEVCGFQGFRWQSKCPQGHPLA